MLKLVGVTKTYRTSDVETVALREVSLEVRPGEFLAIMGPSGCGKSTLLNMLGLLDSPSSGQLFCLGKDITQSSERQLTLLRRAHIGFVFQNFNLIEELSVEQNVEVALIYRNVAAAERKTRIAAALEQVGLAPRARHLPHQLSGGQQQRAAVARALVSAPQLILADEPTGNLDTANGEAVLAMLSEIARTGTSVVMVTHSRAHAAAADRTVNLLDGHVVPTLQLAA
jgi:putative ABC transport system ATP-binding protein